MERVETAFIANGESYKYAEFENLLKSFDATTEKASDLYVVSINYLLNQLLAERQKISYIVN